MPTVRRAGPDDVEAIERIVETAYSKYLARGFRPGPMNDDYRRKVDLGEMYVLEDAGRVIALIGLLWAEDHLLVENVAVAPGRQREGHGPFLLAWAEDRARERGTGEMRLYTAAAMTENISLYNRLGWAEDHRRTADDVVIVHFTKQVKVPA